jgi:hypothetical protein
MVECLINTEGKLTEAKVVKGLSDDADTEAVRAILLVGGSWNPAVYQNRVVNQKIIVPVRFALN